MERLSLIGPAHKRLAMIAATESVRAPASKKGAARKSEVAALKEMEHQYQEAEKIGWARQAPRRAHPALNRVGAQLARAEGRAVNVDADVLAAISRALEVHADAAPDFWNVAGQIEVRMAARGDQPGGRPASCHCRIR